MHILVKNRVPQVQPPAPVPVIKERLTKATWENRPKSKTQEADERQFADAFLSAVNKLDNQYRRSQLAANQPAIKAFGGFIR